MEIGEKFLPVGTVLLLKEADKKLMITGFCSTAAEYPHKVFDYTGCMYPEGYISSEEVCLFDHEQIGQIFSRGYIDEDETQFKEELKIFLEEREAELLAKQ